MVTPLPFILNFVLKSILFNLLSFFTLMTATSMNPYFYFPLFQFLHNFFSRTFFFFFFEWQWKYIFGGENLPVSTKKNDHPTEFQRSNTVQHFTPFRCVAHVPLYSQDHPRAGWYFVHTVTFLHMHECTCVHQVPPPPHPPKHSGS